MENEIMSLITYGGEARSKSMMALKKIEKSDFEEAKALLKEAANLILQAHKVQTSLLQAEARGESESVQLLMVHAQDHLMDAMVIKDLTESILVIQKQNSELFEKLKEM
jgi:cellobiose-specific phosphotransferase system component IIA